jgi:hypothetical protein
VLKTRLRVYDLPIRRKSMKRVALGLSAIGVISFLANVLVSGHHAIAGKFDPAKTVTLNGAVTGIDWANPHAHLFVDVRDRGSVANWAIELPSPIDLQRSGWSRETLKTGDAVTVQGISARDGSLQAWGNSVVITSTGSRVFTLSNFQRLRNGPTLPTPLWPDGQPRLGPPPGERGYRAYPSSSALVQSGANVEMDADGLLRNIADVDKVAPFQRWARDLYELRQRNFLRDDPLFLYCMPPGGPRQFQQPYGIQFVEERDRQRIFVLIGGGNHNFRYIYTDGRPQQNPRGSDFDNPLFYGRSVGRWQGEALVVDTVGFNEKFWFSNGGLPHTEQLRLIERFSRPDFNTLRYEVTIDDPGAYTKMWTASWTLQWVPGEELPPYYCQDNRP